MVNVTDNSKILLNKKLETYVFDFLILKDIIEKYPLTYDQLSRNPNNFSIYGTNAEKISNFILWCFENHPELEWNLEIIMYLACKYNWIEIANLCLEKGLDIDINNGRPFSGAVMYYNVEMINFLLSKNPKIIDDDFLHITHTSYNSDIVNSIKESVFKYLRKTI